MIFLRKRFYKSFFRQPFPANTYLLKVNNRNIRKRFELCSELTNRSGAFIVNFEHILPLFLVFLLLTLNKKKSARFVNEKPFDFLLFIHIYMCTAPNMCYFCCMFYS